MKKLLFNVLSLALLLGCFWGTSTMDVKAISYETKAIDTTFTDFLKEDGIDNWYKMKTTKEGYFTLTFDPAYERTWGWDMYIYDKDYNEIKHYWNIQRVFITDRLMFAKESLFFVKIQSHFDGSYAPVNAVYTITTKQVNDDVWEKEENGTTTKANVLKSGKALYGTLWKNDDMDYFSFKITKTGYTRFKFAVEEEGDIGWGWNIYFKDSTGKDIYNVSDIKNDYVSRKFNFKKGTTVYVVVCAHSDSSYAPVDIKYSLKPIETEKKTWEIERNDTVTKATVLTSGKQGTIYCSEDVDFYRYKATATKNRKIKFTIEDDVRLSKGWNVTVYKSKIDHHNIVASQSNITDDTTLKFKAKKGVSYYMVVKAYVQYGYADVQDVLYKVKVV